MCFGQLIGPLAAVLTILHSDQNSFVSSRLILHCFSTLFVPVLIAGFFNNTNEILLSN